MIAEGALLVAVLFIMVTPFAIGLNFEEPESWRAKVLLAVCVAAWFAPALLSK